MARVRVLPEVARGWRGHIMLPVEIALGYANVRTCPACGEQFEPVRDNQKYCGRGCSNRVQQVKWWRESKKCKV